MKEGGNSCAILSVRNEEWLVQAMEDDMSNPGGRRKGKAAAAAGSPAIGTAFGAGRDSPVVSGEDCEGECHPWFDQSGSGSELNGMGHHPEAQSLPLIYSLLLIKKKKKIQILTCHHCINNIFHIKYIFYFLLDYLKELNHYVNIFVYRWFRSLSWVYMMQRPQLHSTKTSLTFLHRRIHAQKMHHKGLISLS